VHPSRLPKAIALRAVCDAIAGRGSIRFADGKGCAAQALDSTRRIHEAEVERASAEAYVLTVYRELLAREPPEPERDGWVATLLDGTAPDAVRTAILGSDEYIERRRIIAHRDAIARTWLFDRSWYLASYPDVAAAGLDPLEHYARFGRLEGRRPSAYFDDAWYRDQAQIPSGTDALLDYAERANRRASPRVPASIRSGIETSTSWHPASRRWHISWRARRRVASRQRAGCGRCPAGPAMWIRRLRPILSSHT